MIRGREQMLGARSLYSVWIGFEDRAKLSELRHPMSQAEPEFEPAMQSPRFTRGPRRPKPYLLLLVPLALVLAVVLAVAFSARRALNHAHEAAASQGQLAFTLRALDPADNLAQSRGFESVAAGPNYTTGTFFDGDLYVGGQFGLTIIRSDGTARVNLRTGFELPIASIGGMAATRLRGNREPLLLLATRGAGLLLLEPHSNASPTIHQLLPADPEARDLTALLSLATGDILLGTRHRGVIIYNGVTLMPLRFTLPGVNPGSLQVTALASTGSASFLIGTRDAGVLYVHAGTVDHIDSRSGLPDDQVESITVSSRHIFVGTPVGTAEFDLAAPSFRPIHILGQGLFSHTLAVDKQQLLVGTLDQGIQQIPLEDRPYLRRASISAGLPVATQQRVDAFLHAPDALYALVDGALMHRSSSGWTPALPPTSETLTDSNISALAFAPDGTLYVGFFDRGVDLLTPEGTIRHFEDDHLFCINRLALDPQRHTMAAATANGLVLFDAQGTPRQILTRRDGLISDHVTDVAFTKTGTALATPAGITFVGPSGTESLYAFQGLVNNHVYTLAYGEGSDQLLAGTLGGISILKADTVEHNFTATNSSLKHNWVTALLPMPENTVLIGTYGSGLETLDRQGRFAPIELPSGTPRDLIINPNALFATASHMYAGTLDHGMLVYSTSTNRWSAISSGLPSLNVTAFASRAGDIYVGTENGLVRIPEANLP